MSMRIQTSPVASPRGGWKSYLPLGLAIIFCPCHLVLLLAALAGTTLGVWIIRYALGAFLVLLGLWVLSLVGLCVLSLLPSPSMLARRRATSHARASREVDAEQRVAGT